MRFCRCLFGVGHRKSREDRLQFYQTVVILCIVFAVGVHTGLQLREFREEEESSPLPSSAFRRHRRHLEEGLVVAKAPPPAPPVVRRPLRPNDLEEVRRRERERLQASRGAFTDFVRSGKSLPIVVLACNRAEMLRDALSSLVNGAKVERKNILVVQDGSDQAVADVVEREFGLRLERRPKDEKKRRDGAVRIASNYKYALEFALMSHFTDAPGVIVAEDDLLFSPDFVRYFESLAPLLDSDPTIFVASAWNDNGFFEKANPKKLLRTQYFPGLGWLLPRALWLNELRDAWPRSHWDHWLRDKKRHKGRECVYPMVPRSYHAGAKGTFMDDWHHNRYFAPIKYNLDPGIALTVEDVAEASLTVYEARLHSMFSSKSTVHLGTKSELDRLLLLTPPPRRAVFWYSWKQVQGTERTPPNFVCLSETFRLWHEHQRASRNGVHETLYRDAISVLLVNARDSAYSKYAPTDIHPLTEQECIPPLKWRDLGRGD